jgi:hypothetical protein
MVAQCRTYIWIKRILRIANSTWNTMLRGDVGDADPGLGADDQANNVTCASAACVLT